MFMMRIMGPGGVYTLHLPYNQKPTHGNKTTVAVKIADVLGEEILVTEIV